MSVRRRLNREALVRFTGIPDEDLVMCSDSNQVSLMIVGPF